MWFQILLVIAFEGFRRLKKPSKAFESLRKPSKKNHRKISSSTTIMNTPKSRCRPRCTTRVNHFEDVDSKSVRCIHCSEKMCSNTEVLRNHMQIKHPEEGERTPPKKVRKHNRTCFHSGQEIDLDVDVGTQQQFTWSEEKNAQAQQLLAMLFSILRLLLHLLTMSCLESF